MEKNSLNPNNLTIEQMEAGLDQLKKWFPEESEMIDLHKKTILTHIIDGVEIPADHPIRKVKPAAAPELVEDVSLTNSPCTRSVVEFVVEAGTFTVMVAGCVTAARFDTYYSRQIADFFGNTQKYEREIQPLLNVLNAAEGKLAKAKAFAPIAQKLWDFGIIKIIFNVIKDKSSYADWLIDGAIALSQIIVWVGSEFIAAVAEIAVVIFSATALLLSGIETVKVCI